MKISDALALGKNQLEKAGVSNGKLDSLILLSYALSFSREQIIFNPDFVLDEKQQQLFLSFIERRASFEPVSHILGKREFYGRDFIVSKDVLDPRPDSESLIELVLKNFSDKNQKLNILEIGCGSGCLIITLLKELQNAYGVAVDISEAALEVCKKNANFHEVQDRLQFLKSDVFDNVLSITFPLREGRRTSFACESGRGNDNIFNPPPTRFARRLPLMGGVMECREKFDLIISNPPYIESAEIEELQPEVRIFEPRMALDGGLDGLDFYREIAFEAKNFLNENGKVIIEIGFGQADEIKKIFADNDFEFIESKFDLSGVERALCFNTF
ncbi:MAG: peptide chain release factor N(5)-glutamine methyltransferase [Rickettsiales bacterium]|nr:peptide chain release factor N(5)-glutamine methyltransferase [Rickettsiales bacterium]